MSTRGGDKTINYHNGDVYKGEVDGNDRPHGKGTYTHHDEPDQIQQGSYVGEWKDGEKDGNGIHYYRNGDVYDGPWRKGKRHGPAGKYTYYNKRSAKYRGDWIKDMKHGQGIMLFANGDKYEGHWEKNDREDGKATYTYKDGSTYVGKCSVSLDVSK